MVRYISRVLKMGIVVLFSIVFLFTASTMMAPTSRAATHTASLGNPTDCHTLLVHLNGKQTPTKTCLDKLPNTGAKHGNTKAGVVPNTDVTDNCAPAFELYSDANYSGYTICFIGQGWVSNLEDYCLPSTPCPLGNWNDIASSYWAGCSDAYLYSDSNGGGQRMFVQQQQKGNFNGSKSNPGVMPNDKLSSLNIWSNCQRSGTIVDRLK